MPYGFIRNGITMKLQGKSPVRPLGGVIMRLLVRVKEMVPAKNRGNSRLGREVRTVFM